MTEEKIDTPAVAPIPVHGQESKLPVSVLPVKRKKKTKQTGIYMSSLITRKVELPIHQIGSNIKEVLEKKISRSIEGKCIMEGFIKPNSTKILTYSSGLLKGNFVIFEVVFECLVSYPVEGMIIPCIAKNITKAGIRAETSDAVSPVVIFIARDHNYMSKYFSTIQEGNNIKVRVIGQRYELNDKYISIIGELVELKEHHTKRKPKLVLRE